MGSFGAIEGYPLPPWILNFMLDEIISHLVGLVARMRPDLTSLRTLLKIRWIFYVDNCLIASTNLVWI